MLSIVLAHSASTCDLELHGVCDGKLVTCSTHVAARRAPARLHLGHRGRRCGRVPRAGLAIPAHALQRVQTGRGYLAGAHDVCCSVCTSSSMLQASHCSASLTPVKSGYETLQHDLAAVHTYISLIHHDCSLLYKLRATTLRSVHTAGEHWPGAGGGGRAQAMSAGFKDVEALSDDMQAPERQLFCLLCERIAPEAAALCFWWAALKDVALLPQSATWHCL